MLRAVGGLLQAGGSPWVTLPRKGGFSVSQGTWKWGHSSVLLSHLSFPENVILGDFSREFLVFNCVWDAVRLVRAAELSQHRPVARLFLRWPSAGKCPPWPQPTGQGRSGLQPSCSAGTICPEVSLDITLCEFRLNAASPGISSRKYFCAC